MANFKNYPSLDGQIRNTNQVSNFHFVRTVHYREISHCHCTFPTKCTITIYPISLYYCDLFRRYSAIFTEYTIISSSAYGSVVFNCYSVSFVASRCVVLCVSFAEDGAIAPKHVAVI
jgi:hypothetical protein